MPAQPYHCVRCGYDLTGLARSSNCPECATPVARSHFIGSRLTPRDFRVLRWGTALVLASFASWPLLAVATVTIAPHPTWGPLQLLALLTWLSAACWPAGWWLISGATFVAPEQRSSLRVALTLITIALIAAPAPAIWEPLMLPAGVAAVLGLLALILSWISGCLVVAGFGWMANDLRFCTQAQVTACAPLVLVGGAIAGSLYTESPAPLALAILAWACGVSLLWRFRRRIVRLGSGLVNPTEIVRVPPPP